MAVKAISSNSTLILSGTLHFKVIRRFMFQNSIISAIVFLLLSIPQHTIAQCGIDGKVIATNCYGENTLGFIETYPYGQGRIKMLWSTGERWQHLKDLKPGTYTLTITDGAGCTATKAFTVTEARPISVDANITLTDNGKYTVVFTTVGGKAPYFITIINSTKSETLQLIGYKANNISEGDYLVVVRDSDDCSTSKNITVPNPNPTTGQR